MRNLSREAALLDEAVRLHYLSLEGSGKFDEALFFLDWHYDNREHRKTALSMNDIAEVREAQRTLGYAGR
jgi:hypothetical protein